jgi:Flp pilus assembly protein CpaB
VVVAIVATFAAYSSAGAPPMEPVVVASRDLVAGEVVEAGDLRLDRADLPGATLGQVFGELDALYGSVVLAPRRTGELVQRSDVLLPDPAEPTEGHDREFSLPLERDRAVEGDLAPGETVDVLATYGTGESAYTVVVARRARVVRVSESSGGLGSDGRVVVMLALGSANETLAATHASAVATVTLVRATRAATDDGTSADRYPPAQPSR